MLYKPSDLETHLRKAFSRIIGIDESGCANFVGPAVVAGVMLPSGQDFVPVTDCKKLTAVQLEKTYHSIIGMPNLVWGYEVVTVSECNHALLKSEYTHIKRLCQHLQPRPDFVLIDYHSVPDKFHIPQWGVEHGDQFVWCIAAASVIAKYIHDQILINLDQEFPMYNLKSNKGSIGHQLFDLTCKYGLTVHHRKKWVESMALKRGVNIEAIPTYSKKRLLEGGIL